MRRPRFAATAAVVVALAGLLAAPATASPAPSPTPTAPRPTSTAASPEAPDPHPPTGGAGPGGLVPGGTGLAARRKVVPAGSAAMPQGVTAKAWALVDLDRGVVLAAKDAHGRYQPASILKTLTALVLLPRLTGTAKVPVSTQAADTEGSAVGLVPGGSYTADDLFTAMLLMSGNDATEALVGAAGGDRAVVAAMNATIRGLGGYDTVVQKPTGLDGWTQLTSAYDMALMLRAAVADRRLRHYDGIRRALLPAQSVPKNGQPVGTIEMDNQSADFLDSYPGALYAKTGFTDAARHTYLAAANQHGTTLGVVFLRAERVPTDQWQQASSLLDWGFDRPADDPGVGTLEDPAQLADRAAATPSPSTSPTASAPSPATPATATARAATARATARDDDGLGRAPFAYLGLVGVLVVVGAFLERRRRRR